MLIAVLMGGPGSEREVSLNSGRAVLSALQEEGLSAVGVDVVDTAPVLPEGVGLAFNVIHGTIGEDGALQGYLEELGVAYTGAGSQSSALAFDKVRSKLRFEEAGIPTPAFEILDVSNHRRLPLMELPYVVKPPREGSSVGVHINCKISFLQVLPLSSSIHVNDLHVNPILFEHVLNRSNHIGTGLCNIYSKT